MLLTGIIEKNSAITNTEKGPYFDHKFINLDERFEKHLGE